MQTMADENSTTLKQQRINDLQHHCRSHILASVLIKTHEKPEGAQTIDAIQILLFLTNFNPTNTLY